MWHNKKGICNQQNLEKSTGTDIVRAIETLLMNKWYFTCKCCAGKETDNLT